MVINFTDSEREFVRALIDMLRTLEIDHTVREKPHEIDLQISTLPSAIGSPRDSGHVGD